MQAIEQIRELDQVQFNMLNLIVSIMNNYQLYPTDVDMQFYHTMEYHSLQPSEAILTQPFEEPKDPLQEVIGQDKYVQEATKSANSDTPSTPSAVEDKKMYVDNRWAFRDALSADIKICPNYNRCTKDECRYFHVRQEHLCPHAGRNNHCDALLCDKIIIKACRKGRRCHDSECSFRH